MPASLQQRHHLVVEGGVLVVDQRVGLGRHRLQVAQRHARARQAIGLEEIGEAHLEELVHVGRHDADVAQPLEQRHVGAKRLGEHAPVELEDRALAVEQRRQRRRHGLDGRTAVGHGQGSQLVHDGSL